MQPSHWFIGNPVHDVTSRCSKVDQTYDQPNFTLQFPRFKRVSDSEKEKILSNKKVKPTNNATKLWVNCFKDYLIEQNHPNFEDIPNTDLPNILKNFYSKVKKRKTVTDGQDSEDYNNTTFRCIHGGHSYYFKDTHKTDIIKNKDFLCANDMFLAMAKVNKQNGLGNINSYPPIVPSDLKLISDYFKRKMYGNPDVKVLQQICVFNVIYYLCHRGRENLHKMTINTFTFDCDPDINL